MFAFLSVTKALTDENRVRILMALSKQEMCVCQITGFLDLSPSTTSKHLSVLRQARLIDNRKKGKWVYYTVADASRANDAVREAIAWVGRVLENKPVILRDRRRIRDILERGENFCSAQERDQVPDSFHSLAVHSLAEDEEQLQE